jgi:hypothetical protein
LDDPVSAASASAYSAASIALSSDAGIFGMGDPVLRGARRAGVSRRASRPPRAILLVW